MITIKTDYVTATIFEHLLSALTWENNLVLSVSLVTGLRLSDVLNLRTSDLKERMTVRELKTGKTKRIRIPAKLLDELVAVAGKIYVFEHRLDHRKHRTRQAVFKDLKRACEAFRLPKSLVIAPHTCRKIYSVTVFDKACDLKQVQALLNHSDEAVTVLYAMADKLTEKKLTTQQKAKLKRLS